MTAPPGANGPACSLGDPQFAERYTAIDARDVRFDGQFVTAVSSTGIYCRPSCPARTPKPENVTFYTSSAAAHEAGFRACRRCLPEATPGTPEWDLRGDLTGRAMRLIADGVVDREGVDGLATRLGYTPRHVHRLLVAELGAGPAALARAQRAQTARSLLVGTDLAIAQVAFAAGFGSVRQFNETVQLVFAARPSDLRARARARASETTNGSSQVTGRESIRLDVDLPVRQPFDAPGVLSFLADRAVEGVESAGVLADGTLRYARTLHLPHGPGAVEVLAEQTADATWRVRARLELIALSDVGPAVARVRRMLDLDADPSAIDAALAADGALSALVAERPGTRAPGTVDPQEILVRALVGQQISVAAARTHLSRLAAALGSPCASTFSGLDRLFPTPEQILDGVPLPVAGEPLDPQRLLRLPARSIASVVGAARALVDGDLELHVGVDAATVRKALLALPGVGPWTASYVAMRVLGDPDTWLDGDVALLSGARTVGLLGPQSAGRSEHRVLAARAQGWAPWRSYAVMYLWRASSQARSVGAASGPSAGAARER
ncbi:helix-turn-helix domain-containing protein [Sanguibacter sp. 4.1]|uniref:DNA-3-methyladenine glycosylase II n=1 Tax=Sanguibacter biliveldensis TaxID=3030830 RepID=A0AAF0Z7F7_9MICO|nr:AlkA N-terminal domain-containing protein [Sanguibacter sp. 4.1]WPF84180.1 helix-turn-helix domain-containing protein [Sanguibacter sp. 4.1]